MHVALLWPLTECTNTDSVASRASSINSKMALAASSLGSSSIYIGLNARENTYLIVLVKPEECQISNTDRLPVVLNLAAGAVNDVGDFVGHDKLQILKQSV